MSLVLLRLCECAPAQRIVWAALDAPAVLVHVGFVQILAITFDTKLDLILCHPTYVNDMRRDGHKVVFRDDDGVGAAAWAVVLESAVVVVLRPRREELASDDARAGVEGEVVILKEGSRRKEISIAVLRSPDIP